ncbi:MAG: FtsQ-type POTRA domain-containing protein [Bacteroidota bacterium]
MEPEQEHIPLQEERTYGTRVYVWLFLLALFILATLLVKAKWQQHVPVRQVVVEGIHILSKDDIIHLMKLKPNVPMADMDLTAIQQNIIANSFVKQAVVKRDSPEMLSVTIEERKPAAMLVAHDLFYIDEDGIVLPYLPSTETYDIPVISGYDSTGGIQSGQKIMNPDVLDALEIIKTSKAVSDNLFHTISEIRVRKGHDMVLFSFDTGIPIIFGKGETAKKLVKLDAFWQKFVQNSETKDIQYIDLRFDDQVVVSRKSIS